MQNQSQLNIDRVIDESRPYMTRSISRKVEEFSIVNDKTYNVRLFLCTVQLEV